MHAYMQLFVGFGQLLVFSTSIAGEDLLLMKPKKGT